MDLFQADPASNLLPQDGTVHYYGPIMSATEANRYEARLMEEVAWEHDEAHIFGRHIITKRKVAWYGEQDFSYTYSGATKQALPWTESLRELKELAESKSGAVYNSCLLNLYHTGEEGMAWHSDDEKELAANAAIASLSFGAERVFRFKHKETDEVVSLVLEHGSLLVMKDETQRFWRHRLPTTKKVTTPRINLTFRLMNPPRG